MSSEDKDPYLSELESLDVDNPEALVPEPVEVGVKPAAPAPQPQEKKLDKPKEKRPKKLTAELAPDIPVQLSAVLGSREVTLQELANFKAGEVISLGTPPNQVVDLVVNGRAVAKGELVEIDGKLGVRVLKVV